LITSPIWLFGSYARGDYINDRRVDEYGVVSEYNSDVDILVVLRGKDSFKKSKMIKKFVGRVEDSPIIHLPPNSFA
jgi:predicted nucleotidyltransferase